MGLSAAGADLSPIEPGLDYHSFANVDQFRVTHIDLDLRVDLEDKVISGVVDLEFAGSHRMIHPAICRYYSAAQSPDKLRGAGEEHRAAAGRGGRRA